MKAPKWWSRHGDAIYSGGLGFVATTILLTMHIAGLI